MHRTPRLNKKQHQVQFISDINSEMIESGLSTYLKIENIDLIINKVNTKNHLKNIKVDELFFSSEKDLIYCKRSGADNLILTFSNIILNNFELLIKKAFKNKKINCDELKFFYKTYTIRNNIKLSTKIQDTFSNL